MGDTPLHPPHSQSRPLRKAAGPYPMAWVLLFTAAGVAVARYATLPAGFLACLLAARADCVVQMFCGLPTILKGELPKC